MRKIFTQPIHAQQHTKLSWRLGFLLSAFLTVTAGTKAQSPLVSLQNGQLVYNNYANEGQTNSVNKIPDFSNVGYKGGGVALPNLSVVETVAWQSGDCRTLIQAAIDRAEARTPDANGFRGAVLIKAGAYVVSGSLSINASGVVLRGEGNGVNGTVLLATETPPSGGEPTLIFIQGSGSGFGEVSGTRVRMGGTYVASGTRTFTVGTHTFAVGDNIVIRKTPNQDWINAIGMDMGVDQGEDPPRDESWQPSEYQLNFERKITAISGNTITVDMPLVDPIESRYGGADVFKSNVIGRIQNCGVENIRLESKFASATDEAHAWNGVTIRRAENSWVQDVVAKYFAYSCVSIASMSRNITVEDCAMIDPKSTVGGGRRYSFNLESDATANLFQRCIAYGGRHDFTSGSKVPGPNVFVDCAATNTLNDIGPHHRYATGQLYDNIYGGEMRVQNRLFSGSGHGWSGAQILFWNCRSTKDGYEINSPNAARNWAIGVISDQGLRTGNGYWESWGTHVLPRSLYLKQLEERLGPAAVQNTATAEQINNTLRPQLLNRISTIQGEAPVVAGPPQVTTPAAPTNLAADAISPTEVNLKWTDNSTNETGFKIQRSVNGGAFADFATVGADVNTFVVDNLTVQTNYLFQVRAEGSSSSSAYTAPESTTTLAANTFRLNDRTVGTGQNEFDFNGTGWEVINASENFFNDFTQSITVGAFVDISFTGTKIAIFGKKKSDSGIAGFSIDGGAEATGDFYSANETFKGKVWESGTLSNGPHTLRIRLTGTQNSASTGIRCRIDFAEILTPVVAAPSNLSYATNPASYTQGTAISANAPTVTGTVDTYSVSPALPAGLNLNASTGVISGTPTTATAATNYTVRATNSGGFTETTLNITVTASTLVTLNDRTIGTNQGQFEYEGTGWTVIANQAGNYNNDFTQSNVTGSYVNIRFTGTKITLYAKKKADSGFGMFSIDGGTETVGDFYAATESFQAKVWESPMLPYGTHILKVRLAGTKNTASTNYYTRIDFAEVSTAITAPTSLSYSSNPATYTVGTAITANTPTVGGTATVTSYSVSPALPAGLSLNTTTGVISGTPSASAASAVYVVTVSNSAGSTTENLTITVNQSVITLNDRTTGTGQNQFEYATTAQWAVITGQAGNYNSDFTQSATSGAYVHIRFTGTRIAIYGKKKPDSGIGAFSIDAGTESDGDFYAATETFQAKVWESPVLPYGTHILKVRMKNAKIAASTGYLCRIDYAVVTNAGTGATLSKNNTEVASLQLERESTAPTLSLNYIGGNVTFDLPASGYTTLDVYNLNGQKVAALVKGNKTAGAHSAALNSRNLAAGLYVIRLTSGKEAKAIKVLLQ